MKTVIACDSFKGSLDSLAAGRAAAAGVLRGFAGADVAALAVADGGEGTVEALVSGLDGRFVECTVSGPLGEPVKARYGLSRDGLTAVMEMSAASGLTLVAPGRRNPLLASTLGTGQMIADALERGCTNIVMGIGGSATNDGGMGMLAALGAVFSDAAGDVLEPCGAALERVAAVDLTRFSPDALRTRFNVACDVDNPLCGQRGASAVFGPQKGADEAMVRRLDAGLANYARAMAAAVGADHSADRGAGAAGGLGFALAACLGARLKPGIDLVLDTIGFDDVIDGADLVITGEGRMDAQTVMGKTPLGVLRRAASRGIPVVALAGSVDEAQALLEAGFLAVLPVVAGPCTLERAMDAATAKENIARTAEMAARLYFHNRAEN